MTGSTPSTGERRGTAPPRSRGGGLLPAAVALLAALPFLGAVRNGFVELDDPFYLTGNPWVTGGITGESFLWSFTTFDGGTWHPVTWLSHMADVSLFGMEPAGHHLVSVLLHGANAALLFLLFRRLTGRPWASAFAALLFAVHPLRAEVVAWGSERKELLSSFFCFLSAAAWTAHRERPSARRYGASLLSFALALLSKPMAVTLPLVLLAVDAFPLRVPPGEAALPRRSRFGQVRERIPFFLLSALSAAATLALASRAKALVGTDYLPVHDRIANALVAPWAYAARALHPEGLAVFYPLPEAPWGTRALLAGAALVASAAAAALLRRSRPYLALGGSWFLATLLPVSGIFQAGLHGQADRYTYLPLAGPSLALALLLADAAGRERHSLRLPAAASAAAAAVVLLSAAAWRQTAVWRDTDSLYRHALEVTRNNWKAHRGLAVEALRAGREEEARRHLREVLRIAPAYPRELRGKAREERGWGERDLSDFVRSVAGELEGRSLAQEAIGLSLAAEGGGARAVHHLREAVRVWPRRGEGHYNLAVALAHGGRRAEAAAALRERLRTAPDDGTARDLLGRIVGGEGEGP